MIFFFGLLDILDRVDIGQGLYWPQGRGFWTSPPLDLVDDDDDDRESLEGRERTTPRWHDGEG